MMRADKKRKLENAGWRVGDARDFLDLTPAKVDAIQDDLRKRWRERQKQVPLDRTILGVGPGATKT